MSDVETMMHMFGLSEEDARAAIASGFRVTAIQGNGASDWLLKESGIGKCISDAEKVADSLKELAEKMKE